MSIESLDKTPAPFSATPEEIATREAMFAPDVDYTALSAGIEAIPEEASPTTIEVPQLEDVDADEPAPLPKRFTDNLLPADQIPQLEDDNATESPASGPEGFEPNLLPADQIPQLEPDQDRMPRHRL